MFRRSFFAAAALACASAASAQTTLELTFTPPGGTPQTCLYTTDANNVSMKPSGNLGATGSFGTNCPATTTTTPPVGTPSFVNPLTGDIAATMNTGGTAALAWQADADTCSYDGSTFPSGVSFGTNWPASGIACTSAASCNTLHSVNLTIPADGAYTFKLTCSKTGNAQAVSSTATTTATTPVSTGCAGPGAGITRQFTGNVCTQNDPDNCRGADLTKFENVFGNGTTAWPGIRGLPQRVVVNTNQFVALQFTVPANFSNKGYGSYVGSEINLGGSDIPYISMTVSPTCGDFSVNNPISPRCLLNQGAAAAGMIWSTYPAGTTTYNESCHLTPGQTYYLNVLYAPLGNPGASTCTDSTCNRTIKNDLGNY